MVELTSMSGKDLMQAAYPARWYGIVHQDPVTKNKVITKVIDTGDSTISVYELFPADTMVALTEGQYSSAVSDACKIPVTEDNKLLYPNRYIATYDQNSSSRRVTGWVDLWNGRGHLIKSAFVAVRAHDWHTPGYRTDQTKVVVNDKIVSSGQIHHDMSKQEIAFSLLSMFEEEMLRKFSTRNKPVPPEAVAYISQLETIINSDDTTLELPTRPDV